MNILGVEFNFYIGAWTLVQEINGLKSIPQRASGY